MHLLSFILTLCLLGQVDGEVAARQKKAVRTLSLKLESATNSIPPGAAPVLRLTIENVSRADERILKPRGDLQDTYYDLVITDMEGRELSLPRAFSCPGPIIEADFVALKPGKKLTFEFSTYAVAVHLLLPGRYQMQIRFWQDPQKSHTTAVMSPAKTITVARLPIIQTAPPFVLSDQSGKKVALADLKDKVVIVGFIFTTCSGSCPATTSRMVLLQEELKRRGQWGKDVKLLSITLDPARDTPEKLRHYMSLYDVDANGWSFLTGPVKEVNRVIGDWGMWVKKAANEQLDHPSRVFLVDRRGRIREIYNLEFFRIPWVMDDIDTLRKEK